MARGNVIGLTGFRASCARKPGAFLETGSLYPPQAALRPFPLLGYLRAKSRLTAVALRNTPAGAVPRTPFTRKGYAASVKRHSR